MSLDNKMLRIVQPWNLDYSPEYIPISIWNDGKWDICDGPYGVFDVYYALGCEHDEDNSATREFSDQAVALIPELINGGSADITIRQITWRISVINESDITI